MIGVPEIRKWLQKMEYTDPNPSEEALNILCKGDLGLVFSQIVNKVKPLQEVASKNKNSTNWFSVTDVSNSFSSYTESKSLNPQNLVDYLHDLKTHNVANELNFQHLSNKMKSKDFNRKLMAQKVWNLGKANTLLKSKSIELDSQINLCEKLLSQHNLVQQMPRKKNDTLVEKINVTLQNIEQSFEKFNHQLPIIDQEFLPIFEIPHNSHLQTSVILSSNKKSLSTIKCPKRANSTCKNIFEMSNNFSLMSSTLRKHNMSKISECSVNNTTMTNNGKPTELLKELELTSWKDTKIREFVDEIWYFGSDNIFKIVSDLQSKQKNKIVKLIADNDNSKNDFSIGNENNIPGLEVLHAFHVQTELKTLKCKQQQLKLSKLLERNSNEFINDILILEASEAGLLSSVTHLRQSITKIQEEYSDNSKKLNQVFADLQNVKSAINATESQINTNLNFLKNCQSTLENWRKSVYENMKHSYLDTDNDWIKSNIVQKETENFISCPILEYNLHPMDSMYQIFNKSDVKNLHSCAFLKPDAIIRQKIIQKLWLDKLQMIQKSSEDLYDMQMCDTEKSIHDVELTNDLYKKSSEKLKWVTDMCTETTNRLNDFNMELNCNLKTALNDCLAEYLVVNGKHFKECVDKYDEYYKLL